MSQRTKDMTSGRPAALIFTFALPLMVGNVFQQLYTVVDTAVVGKALGVGALAALGATDWLSWMMLGLVQGLTQGPSIRMANHFGAKQDEDLRITVGNATILAIISAIVLFLLGQTAAEPVLRLLQTPDAVLPNAVTYLRIIYGGVPIIMAYNLFSAILRALGDGKTPLIAMLIAAAINIALDLLFVLVFHWGIPGAAAATLIGQAFSAVFCLRQIRKLEILRLKKQHFRPRGKLCLNLLLLGAPMAMQNLLISVGGLIVQNVVNLCGVTFIAGFTATNKLYGVFELAAIAYGYAMITYVGQNVGAERIDRVKSGVRAACWIAVGTSVVIAILMLVFGRLILSCFLSGTPAEVEAAMSVAYRYLTFMCLCLPVLYLLYIWQSSLRGLGNTFLPMLSGIAEFFVRAIGVHTLPGLIGSTGIFLSEVGAWFGADLVLATSYFLLIRSIEKRRLL